MHATTPRGSATGPFAPDDIAILGAAAHRAPSVLNTQPWRFRALADGLEIHEDSHRALPVIDPRGRERTISCGAAIFNAELAMAHLGWQPHTVLLPDATKPTLLATVMRALRQPRAPATEHLYEAIPHRRTHRRVFMPATIGGHELDTLRTAAEAHQAWLHVVDRAQLPQFAKLLWRGAQAQGSDEALRREVGRWMRPAGEGDDGVPVGSMGTAPYPVDGIVSTSHDAAGTAPAWLEEELGRATVAVLFTARDERDDWLRAGMGLEQLLLTATRDGLVVSFADQPVEQSEVRPEIARVLREPGYAQSVMRIGQPMVTVPPTPRRPLSEMFLD